MDHPPVLPRRKQVPLLPRLSVLWPAQHRIFVQQHAPHLHTCTLAEICPEPTGPHSLLALTPLLCCHLGQRALRPAQADGLTSLSLRFSRLKYGEGRGHGRVGATVPRAKLLNGRQLASLVISTCLLAG